MNIMDWLLIIISIAVALAMLFVKRNPRLDIAMLALVAISVLLHGLSDQFRLQLFPTYAVVLVIAVFLVIRVLKPVAEPRPKSVFKKSSLSVVVVAVTVISVLFSNYLPIFTMPEPTGKYAVGTISRHLTDETREETITDEPGDKRELMVNVWYPVDAEAAKSMPKEHFASELSEAIRGGYSFPKQLFSHVKTIPTHVVKDAAISTAEKKYPVVLFSPGNSSTRFQSMTTVEELVSHGFIVVGIDHPYTAAKVVFPDGREIVWKEWLQTDSAAEMYKFNSGMVGIRAADASFVLDTLTQWNANDPDERLTGKLDLDHVGIFGHSLGGATAAETLATDGRFKAGLSWEGATWGTVAHTALKQPFMYIMTEDTDKSFDPGSEKVSVFYDEFVGDLKFIMTKSQNDTYYLTVDQFHHQSFTELALLSPPLFANGLDPVHTVDINRSYAKSFFDRYLKGDTNQPLLDGPSPDFPEVKFDIRWAYTKKRG